MKTSLSLTALIACSLLWGCSKNSNTIGQPQHQNEVSEIKKSRTGAANLAAQTLNGKFDSLIQLGKKPDQDSVDYYTVKEEILPDGTKKLIVSALVLNISESSAQDFFKRSNGVSEVYIFAEKINISTELKFPGAKIAIKADELSFSSNGKISTSATVNAFMPEHGKNGENGKNAGDIVLDVKELKLGDAKIRFEMNGAKGQAAGYGKPGAPGVSVAPIRANIIKECITTSTQECPFDTRSIIKIKSLSVNGNTTCSGTDIVPTSGRDATPAGYPGTGGNAGIIYLPNKFPIRSFVEFKKGEVGNGAPLAYGGSAGTPVNAVIRKVVKTVPVRCSRPGGGRPGPTSNVGIDAVESVSEVVIKTTPGADTQYRTVTNTATPGDTSDLKNIIAKLPDLLTEGDVKRLKLEYAKDLYRNNYFAESREVLNTIKDTNSAALEEVLITDESNLYLNQLNSNKDFYGQDLDMAPVISLEATMNIYKQNVRISLNTMSLAATAKKTINTAKDTIDNLLNQKIEIRNQMEIARQNHETAYALVPELEIKLVTLEDSKLQLEESLRKVEAQIIAEATSNIHSAEKKKKLFGGLKLIAKLVSVSPLGAPASQVIGASLSTILDMSQDKEADWQDVIKNGYGIYSDLKKVDWKKSHEDWNQTYASLDKDVFLSTSKIDKQRTMAYLTHLHETTLPLTNEIKKYYDNTYSKKVPANQYEAEVARIKEIHPLFKELVAKLDELQQNKSEVEMILSQVNNSLITSKSEIIRDFAMVTALETKETNFSEGLNFSLREIVTKIDKDAKNRLLKYKAALIKAYQYRTLMPFPGNLDLEKINDAIAAFSNKVGQQPSLESLINVYEDDIAVIGQSLFNYIQTGNFKEYDNEYTMDLTENELAELSAGKTIYLDLSKEEELFNHKDNVRIISIEIQDFTATNVNNKNADLTVTHQGTSVLTKNGHDYLFNHLSEANQATWVSRMDLSTNTPVLIKESSSNKSLLLSILGLDANDGILLFNRVGAKGYFALDLKNAKGSVITQGTIKINYTYSIQ